MEDEKRLERQTELHTAYLKNMQLIKFRIRAIGDIISGKRTTTYKRTNIEFCVLQTRKILELIALSALVSDRDVYEEYFKNINTMWNARIIFLDLERIHPDFYPHPIVIDAKNKFNWDDRDEPFLTKEKFLKIYERCGKYLHESAIGLSDEDIENAYGTVWEEIPQWIQLIINLLWTHTIKLYNQRELFYIALGDENEPAHGNIFTAMN